MSTEALAHPADITFVEALLSLSKLTEMPTDSMTVQDGRIVELRLTKPRPIKGKVPAWFGALKELPPFAPLTQLRKLHVAGLKRIKALRYDGPRELIELCIDLEGMMSLELVEVIAQTFALTAPALQTFTGKLRVLKKLSLSTPIAIPLEDSVDLHRVELSGGAGMESSALKQLSKLVVLHVHSTKHNVPFFVDLANHPKLSSLSIESKGRVEVVGNFTTLSHFGVYGNVTPETLHRFADAYNWDEDLTRLEFILRNPNCAEQTANLIYWRASPTWYLQYASDEEVPKDEQKVLALIRMIEAMVEEGRVWAEADIPQVVAEDLNPDVKRVRSLPKHFAEQLKTR